MEKYSNRFLVRTIPFRGRAAWHFYGNEPSTWFGFRRWGVHSINGHNGEVYTDGGAKRLNRQLSAAVGNSVYGTGYMFIRPVNICVLTDKNPGQTKQQLVAACNFDHLLMGTPWRIFKGGPWLNIALEDNGNTAALVAATLFGFQ